MKKSYLEYIRNISEVDNTKSLEVEKYLDSLAKPPGSLGKLEDIVIKLSAIFQSDKIDIKKRCIIVVASDNGVVEEGVSLAPQEVTAIQTINILNGITGVGVLAKQFNTDLTVVDVGIISDINHPKLINKKIRRSTNNITKGAAFLYSEAEEALTIGIELAKKAKESGYSLIGVGEMGIGNTTTSSAVLCALLGIEKDYLYKAIGRGAGLDDMAYQNKINVIESAINLNKPNKEDPIDVLSKVGGLDIATMTGVYIGAAYYGLPVVIDGYISSVAALCAYRLNPLVKSYMFASHSSFERGYGLAINEIGLSPCLNLDMRLGEGSGCPLMFGIMDSAVVIYKNMATFEEANIKDEYLENVLKIGESAF